MGRIDSPVKDFIRATLKEYGSLAFEDLWYLARKGSIKVSVGTLRVMCTRMHKSGELVRGKGYRSEWRLR